MSGQPVSTDSHPPHGHPDNTGPSTAPQDKASTASHPSSLKPDPTTGSGKYATEGGLPTTSTTTSKLPDIKARLQAALRQYPDFPSQGILFEDILPIFADPILHEDLITALEMEIKNNYGEGVTSQAPDIIVGLEARGFLFGPSLALRLSAGFVPVRKQGKLPGKCETASFEKEYGQDFFQIQSDALKQGQRVLIVDDIIATGMSTMSHATCMMAFANIALGGSAAAAGNLIKQAGGLLVGYMFMMELDFLKGREKLDAPVYTLLTGQEKSKA